jgi:hypothetical protein
MDAIPDSAINYDALGKPHAPFPYLVVRLMPAVYGIAPLGRGLTRERLIALARAEHEAHATDLKVFLVISAEETLLVGHDDRLHQAQRPWGGRTVEWVIASARLAPTLRSVRAAIH